MKEEVEEEEQISMAEMIYITRPDYVMLGDYTENALVNFLADLNTSRDTPRRIIYLNSTGGFLDFVTPMVDAIETSNCELVATNRIYSAAFMTFFASDVRKEILPNTLGMFHYPYLAGVALNPNHTLKTQSNTKLDHLEQKLKIPYMEFFKKLLGITKAKHELLLKGGELIYEYDDLVKLLEKSKKLLAKYKK